MSRLIEFFRSHHGTMTYNEMVDEVLNIYNMILKVVKHESIRPVELEDKTFMQKLKKAVAEKINYNYCAI